jgi:hypothetical protein
MCNHKTYRPSLLHPLLKVAAAGLLLGCPALSGCALPGSSATNRPASAPVAITYPELTRGVTAAPFASAPITHSLAAARNEWVDTFLAVGDARQIFIRPPGVQPERVRLYGIVSLPTDTRSVAAVRRFGPGSARSPVPAVLLPLGLSESKTRGVLTAAIPAGLAGLYLELAPALTDTPGQYSGAVWTSSEGNALPLSLTIVDLALSDTPAFSLVGRVDWADLVRMWPGVFPDIEPRLLSRLDGKHIPAIERLDQLTRLARDHRLELSFPALSPTVKVTPREGTSIDWSDYDSIVLPWLTGELDANRTARSSTALEFPVPAAVRAGAVAADEYLAAAISHFDQRRLLARMLVPPELQSAARRVRQDVAARLRGVPASGDSVAVRHLAFAAFAADVDSAVLAGVARTTSAPGAWFHSVESLPADLRPRGDAAPTVLPGLALKFARRAQQDAELLSLGKRRGQGVLSQSLARTAIRFGLDPASPAADLLTPLLDESAYEQSTSLIRALASSPATRQVDSEDSSPEATRITSSLDRPLLLPVSLRYSLESGRILAQASLSSTDSGATISVKDRPGNWSEPALSRQTNSVRILAEVDPTPPPPQRNMLSRSIALAVDAVSGPQELRSLRRIISPVVFVPRSPTAPELDADLGDWSDDQTIHAGRLTRMLDAAAAQNSETVDAAPPVVLLARWTSGERGESPALHLAIRLELPPDRSPAATLTNFARESLGRAAGEDLIRITLVPLGSDRPLQLLLKPGVLAVESQGPGTQFIRAASNLASTPEGRMWRTEVRIPAEALGMELKGAAALEAQLTLHLAATGESASLAGPVDTDRQPLFGLLILK